MLRPKSSLEEHVEILLGVGQVVAWLLFLAGCIIGAVFRFGRIGARRSWAGAGGSVRGTSASAWTQARTRNMLRMTRGLLIVLTAALASRTSDAQTDGKVLKKVEKIDAQLVKALCGLAVKYDDLKDPEAAHFFASSALGYGAKEDRLLGIKNTWEVSVFLGKVLGGKVLADAEPVTTALQGLSQEYRGIRDALCTEGTRGNLGEASKKLLQGAGVKR